MTYINSTATFDVANNHILKIEAISEGGDGGFYYYRTNDTNQTLYSGGGSGGSGSYIELELTGEKITIVFTYGNIIIQNEKNKSEMITLYRGGNGGNATYSQIMMVLEGMHIKEQYLIMNL